MDKIPFKLLYDSSRVFTSLVDIEAYRRSIMQLSFPKEWRETLQRLNIIRLVHGTIAIEGNPKTPQEVERLIFQDKNNITVSAGQQTSFESKQIENAERAFRWIEKEFTEPQPLKEETILHLHHLLTKESDERQNIPGCYRSAGHRVTVGSERLGGVYRPPEGGKTMKQLMKEFINFMNSKEVTSQPSVIQALVGHFYLVTLHPFGNGNGRTARCLEALIMYQHGINIYGFYSLSNYFYRNRDSYFIMLQKTRIENNWELTEFLELGLNGFVNELVRIEGYIKERIQRVMYKDLIYRANRMKVSPRRRLLSDREKDVLLYILERQPLSDPFVDVSPPELWLSEIIQSSAMKKFYADRSSKTFWREIANLQVRGFIKYQKDTNRNDFRVKLNLEVISRY